MGRYYSGDIEGKFMFAVQPSDAGEKFGAYELDRSYIDYAVNRESYDYIVEKLKNIESTGSVERVTAMFEKEKRGYNDSIMEENGVTQEDLSLYADWVLGSKMKKWFDENDSDDLYFTAEI